MTKQVLISIKGLQLIENDDEEVEETSVVTMGNYYCRGGNQYIKYEEAFEGIDGTSQNLIIIKEEALEVRKKGIVDVHMVFEKEKKNISYYTTPYGTLQMGIFTTNIQKKEAQDELELQINYVLEINNEHVADCGLSICATSQKIPSSLREPEDLHEHL